MKYVLSAMFCTGTLLYPMIASAGEITHREVHQEHRIYQGVQQGSISAQEYRNLQRREASVAAQRYRDIHDGKGLQPREREQLNDRLNNISRTIYTDRHR